MTTPTPPDDLPGYDTLPWPQDALAVWWEAGDQAREAVRHAMPELAAALDRAAEEVQQGRGRHRPRWLAAPEQRRPVPWGQGDDG